MIPRSTTRREAEHGKVAEDYKQTQNDGAFSDDGAVSIPHGDLVLQLERINLTVYLFELDSNLQEERPCTVGTVSTVGTIADQTGPERGPCEKPRMRSQHKKKYTREVTSTRVGMLARRHAAAPPNTTHTNCSIPCQRCEPPHGRAA